MLYGSAEPPREDKDLSLCVCLGSESERGQRNSFTGATIASTRWRSDRIANAVEKTVERAGLCTNLVVSNAGEFGGPGKIYRAMESVRPVLGGWIIRRDVAT